MGVRLSSFEDGVAAPGRQCGRQRNRLPMRPRQLLIRYSPDESQTGINVRVFPALLQDRREVLTATGT